MFSRVITLLVTTALSLGAFAQTADLGDVIVVRGTVKDCAQWPDRVLGVQVVEDETAVMPLEGIEVDVLGANAQEILSALQDEIAKHTGRRLKSIWVEVLPSAMYETVASEFIYSANYLLDGRCPDEPRPPISKVNTIDISGSLEGLDKKWQELDREQLRQDHLLRQERMRQKVQILEMLERGG